MTLEEDILTRIVPDADAIERIDDIVRRLINRVEGVVSSKALEIPLMTVGSYAKGTFLRDPDIDLFLMFPVDFPREDMDSLAMEIGTGAIGGRRSYASHPYISGDFEGFDVDIVPCYAVDDPTKIRSAVDRTPFHTRYIKEHMSLIAKDQVRLLKAFMKGIGSYGAEARVEGFSGYLCELLILRYGGFRQIIEAAQQWRPGTRLRLEREAWPKLHDPLIFIDPVDPARNVASALSISAMSLFIRGCSEYFSSPDERFFFPRPREFVSIDNARRMIDDRGNRLVSVVLQRPDLVDDNLYPQIRKTEDGLRNLLQGQGFPVLDSTISVDGDVRIVFELQHDRLPKTARHQGPPVWVSNSKDFLKKWRGCAQEPPFLQEGRWHVYAPRRYRRPTDLILERFIKSGPGSSFRDQEPLVFDHQASFQESSAVLLTSLLDKRPSWEW